MQMRLGQTLIAIERIKPGQAIIIQDGLVRLAIPGIHTFKHVAGHAADVINKGETALWDPGCRMLRRKPQGVG
jgi:hypothetical protein